MNCCACTVAWQACRFGVVFQCVGCFGGVNCGVGGLHFRKQDDVNFKLQPGGDGLEPFATIDVPVGVCEATHAPVVEGDS